MTGSNQQFAFLLVLLLQNLNGYLVQSFGINEPAVTAAKASTPSSRRKFLTTSTATATAAALLVVTQSAPLPAHAAYGSSSNMELPSYIEFLIEKNAGPADPSTFLYQGADPQIQLKRLLEASKRFGEIPGFAEDKKWSQIQGLLTGPLGTLGQSLNAIAKDSTNSKEVLAKAKKVKEDVFNISLAASKKNQADAVTYAKAAEASLDAFVRAAF